MGRCEMRDGDREDVAKFIERHWQSRAVISRGKKYYPHMERGFIEKRNGEIVGLLTYRVDEHGCMELLTLNATLEGEGIGSSLILNAIDRARHQECKKLWFTTTNDRLRAIGFYQRLGFRMTAINLGAVDEARRLKPEIPLVGERGIPMHDEVVMELEIEPYLELPQV